MTNGEYNITKMDKVYKKGNTKLSFFVAENPSKLLPNLMSLRTGAQRHLDNSKGL